MPSDEEIQKHLETLRGSPKGEPLETALKEWDRKLPDEHVNYIINKLVAEGAVKKSKRPEFGTNKNIYLITAKGFELANGTYQTGLNFPKYRQRQIQTIQVDEDIRKSTININKYTKYGLLFTAIFTGLSLIVQMCEHQTNQEQLKIEKQKVDKENSDKETIKQMPL